MHRKSQLEYPNFSKAQTVFLSHQNIQQSVTRIESNKNVDYLSEEFVIIIKLKMENYSQLNMKTIEMKYRSKKEMYDILTIQGGFYLPPITQTSSDFIYDMMTVNK